MMRRQLTVRDGRDPVRSVLSAADLAQQFKVSIRHIRRLDATGQLPRPVRIGRLVRWLSAEIDAWLQAGAPDQRTWEQMKGRIQ